MKLSMWILYDYLKEYHPVPSIVKGECTLRNVRILSDTLAKADSTVYLMRADQYISGEHDKILCVNRQDMLMLETDDLEEVFNKILDCFENYNQWSDTCGEMVRDGCSVQDLFDLSRTVFCDPVLLVDSSHLAVNRIVPDEQKRLAATDEQKAILDQCEELWRAGSLPLSQIMEARSNRLIYKPGGKAYVSRLQKDTRDTILVNLFRQDVLWGWLLLINLFEEATIGKMQVLEELGTVLEAWLLSDRASHEMSSSFYQLFNAVFSDAPKDDVCERTEERLENIGWEKEAEKKLFVIGNRDGDVSVLKNMGYRYSKVEGCITGVIEDKLLLLCNTDFVSMDDFEQELKYKLLSAHAYAGSSYIFQRIRQCREQKNMAEIALSYCEQKPGVICDCASYILPYIQEVLKRNALTDFTHPALNILKSYDEKNHAELYQTLHAFLLHERDYRKTAEKLAVHRNTVQYRIEKIQELTGLDLEDASARLHLLLSYYL